MSLAPLAYVAGLLPLLAINLTYLLAAWAGQVDWCIPYLHSCTSISATGRLPPAYFLFKGLMIPAAICLMLYWLLNAQWLVGLGCRRPRWRTLLVCLGIIAGVGLIFYSVVLGSIGPNYRAIRHSGVSAFFGFSLFAQLLITWLLGQIPLLRDYFPLSLRALRLNILAVLCTGLASVLIGYLNPELYQRTDNAFAWNLTLLLCLHVLLTATLWHRTQYQMILVTRLPHKGPRPVSR